jgi:RNA polymerase primary sigma factor
LTEKLGREPTDKEISVEVNLTERTVNGLRQGKTTTVSIQAPFHPGEEGELKDILPDEKSLPPNDLVQDAETLSHMMSLTDKLEERERVILDLRFGLTGDPPKTLEQVSAAIGRTRERVRQIQNQALVKLRNMLESDGLELENLLNEMEAKAADQKAADADR